MNFAFAQPCWTILLKRNLAQFKYSKLSIRLDVLLNANDKLFYSCQQTLCEKEERKGRQLLTILPGLFISNSGEDIKIDISGLEEGWKIIGSSLVVRRKKKLNVHCYVITLVLLNVVVLPNKFVFVTNHELFLFKKDSLSFV